MEDRTSVRTRIAKETGYTGLSILHRLHHLYGFDVLHDIVYDAMHIIPLNVASHHLHYYLNEEILLPQVVEERLKLMPWTPGMYYYIYIYIYIYMYIYIYIYIYTHTYIIIYS